MVWTIYSHNHNKLLEMRNQTLKQKQLSTLQNTAFYCQKGKNHNYQESNLQDTPLSLHGGKEYSAIEGQNSVDSINNPF